MKLPFPRLRTHSDFIWALWSQSHHRSAGFYKIFFTRFLEKKWSKNATNLPVYREKLDFKFIILNLEDKRIGPDRPRKSREHSSSQHPYDFEFP